MIRPIGCALFVAVLAFGQPGTIDSIRKQFLGGHYREAEAAAQGLVTETDARNGGKDSEDLAEALSLLLEVLYQSPRVRAPEERAIGERAVAMSERLFVPGDMRTLVTRHSFASLLAKDGEFESARVVLEQIVAMQESIPPGVVPPGAKSLDTVLKERAFTWNDLGLVLRRLDDFAAAKSAYEHALELYKERGPEDRDTAVCLNNLAAVLRLLNDYPGALARYRRALAIYEETVGPNHPLVAGCLNNLGQLLQLMNRPSEAAPLLRRSLALAEQAYGPDHTRTGVAAGNLANTLSDLGDSSAAQRLYARALRIQEQSAGQDHPQAGAVLASMALDLARSGRMREAMEAALRADRISREYLKLTARGVPERQALLQTSARAAGMEPAGLYLAISFALITPSDFARSGAMDAVIRDRAMVFDEMAARHRVSVESHDPEIALRTQQLKAAREQLASMVVKGPAGVSLAAFSVRVEQARREKYDAERGLAHASARFRDQLASAEAGLDEIARALEPGTALVSYVSYRRRMLAPGQPSPAYAAFVIRGGKTVPTLVPIGGAAEIDALVSALREQILEESRAPGRSPKRSEAAYRRAGTGLRRRVWDPLSPFLTGIRRVFVVADGSLHLVNLAALPIGDTKYVIERGAVLHYLSSERDLLVPPSQASGQGLLALGDPTSRVEAIGPSLHTATCGDFLALRFAPLPGAAREVREIGAIWTQSGGGPVTELTGGAATKSSFERLAPGKRVLHLAVHSFFLGGCGKPGNGDNPLLLSGLAMAGARDGIVMAEEIVALDLDGLQWAVLSACDTGLGELKSGEDVFGLRRAFQLAGARTVILSLWPVDDSATREWMNALYRLRYVNGKDTASSVKTASMEALTARRARHISAHPFYWAGFVATGDWR